MKSIKNLILVDLKIKIFLEVFDGKKIKFSDNLSV